MTLYGIQGHPTRASFDNIEWCFGVAFAKFYSQIGKDYDAIRRYAFVAPCRDDILLCFLAQLDPRPPWRFSSTPPPGPVEMCVDMTRGKVAEWLKAPVC